MFSKYTNNYAEKANQYAQHKIEGTLLLAYKEFGKLFSKYMNEGNKALDFGCGSGRSTQYLKSVGFDADGVDIDPSMISKAKTEDSKGNYRLIENEKIPQRDSYYDLTFSTLVLLEIPTLSQMKRLLSEIYRTMRFNGTFIVLTVNDDFYNHDWVSVDTNYPENKNLYSGKKVKIKIKEIGLELNDYYWTRNDYRKTAEEVGFSIVEERFPKAEQNDNSVAWLSEKTASPYVIFVMQKTISLQPTYHLINKLDLKLIPGKGYFREYERANELLTFIDNHTGLVRQRNAYSKVYLLLQNDLRWPFHKLKSNEKFEFVEGKDMVLHLISPKGAYEKKIIGKEHNEAVQEYIVQAGTWFAEEMDGKNRFSQITATTIPGYHPDDVEEADKDYLLQLVGDNKEAISVINRLTTTEIPNVSHDLKIHI